MRMTASLMAFQKQGKTVFQKIVGRKSVFCSQKKGYSMSVSIRQSFGPIFYSSFIVRDYIDVLLF